MLSRYGLAPSRQRGQSFLFDANVTRKVVSAAGLSPDDVVVEIGPGFGALTFGLAQAARHVVAVEIDAGVAGAFRAEYGEREDITLVVGDILDSDFAEVAANHGVNRLVVVGNIPYNITSPLVRRLTDERDLVARCLLMVQSEVGARIASEPGESDYSGLSVVTRYHARVRRLFTVKRTCFHPRPKVDSGVIEIAFEDGLGRRSDPGTFETVVHAAFGKRRKMLRQSLQELMSERGLTASEIEETTGIALSRRGETLSVGEFDDLARALAGDDRAGDRA
ncbi:MAG: ribosomal RNA small subunit methyltransferase A [Candidatus Eisenbacteria sp.]|nr:ribosomal RNA small subunit methyltransferase A [Candidatus Eisenbacteria bacterium]